MQLRSHLWVVISMVGACGNLMRAVAPVAVSQPAVAPAQAPASEADPASASAPAATADAPPDAAPPAAVEDTSGIPADLVAVIQAHNTWQDPSHQAGAIYQRNGVYKQLRPLLADFDQAWTAYQARKQDVDAAIAKAANASDADARAALLAVITPVPAGDDGKIDPHARALLEPRDAELPAVEAYFKRLVAARDWQPALEATVLFYTRRHVSDDRTLESLYYLFGRDEKLLDNFTAENGSDVEGKLWQIGEDGAKIRGASPYPTQGETLAAGALASLFAPGQLHWSVVDVEEGKKGDWIMVQVDPTKLDDHSVAYSGTEDWREPKNCQTTDRIKGYDDITGVPYYETECDYDYHSRKITLHAALKVPLPDWAKSADGLAVVGRIVHAGPDWKLEDAFVPDLRYQSGTSLLAP